MGILIGVDVGGTFTDVVAVTSDRLVSLKIPSTPDDPARAFEEGVRMGLDRIGSKSAEQVSHGTTVATNAVLQRTGARTAFISTSGFKDMLHIGRQVRPKLYDWEAAKKEPVVPSELCFELPGRVSKDRERLSQLHDVELNDLVGRIGESDVGSVAVCMLFSFVDDSDEKRIRSVLLEAWPDLAVSISSEVLGEFREYERASTTSLDAYVRPIMSRYLSDLHDRLEDLGCRVVVMKSGGGTMTSDRASKEPVHTLLSGPAAGAVGAAAVASEEDIGDAVAFDMGGTSTDVCLIEGGTPAMASTASIDGLPFGTPSLAIHTVGAGGGSIIWVDGAGALKVGPRSAGADPGPASYGRGAEPTITDAHLLLGHLQAAPPLGGSIELDAGLASRALDGVGRELGVSATEVAIAALDIVTSEMSRAVRVVSVEQGRDPKDLALVAFGGAGPMHSCALADGIGISTVLIPANAGVLSALGLLRAPLIGDVSRTHLSFATSDLLADLIDDVVTEAQSSLRDQGVEPSSTHASIDCRYRGQSHEVTVDAFPLEELPGRFHEAHDRRFGWADLEGEVEAVTLRARAIAEPQPLTLRAVPTRTSKRRRGTAVMRDGEVEVEIISRDSLEVGDSVQGPAMIQDPDSTVLVEVGWDCVVSPARTLILKRAT